jgi:hypothetical protein
MDFTLLNKINKKQSKEIKEEEFDLEIFFGKMKGLDKFFNLHLLNDPNPLFEAIDEIDELTTIHQIENNISLLSMLKEY